MKDAAWGPPGLRLRLRGGRPSRRSAALARQGLRANGAKPRKGDAVDQISLPGSGRTTTRLGFGCAYLLPETAHLLDVAYDAGVRHFDVARGYGRGLTETLVGRFLKRRPDATITTKYGVLPPAGHPLKTVARELLGPWVRRLRRASAPKAASPKPAHVFTKGEFSAEAAAASLVVSLKALQRDRVDLFLMHEAAADELRDEGLLRFLEDRKAAGVIGDFGVGGHSDRVSALYAQHRALCRVLQHDWTPIEPVIERPGTFSIVYRVFGDGARDLRNRLIADAALRDRWSEEIALDLAEPGAFERLMLKAALVVRPNSLVLFSSTRAGNIRRNVETAENPTLAEPAARFARLLAGADHRARAVG